MSATSFQVHDGDAGGDGGIERAAGNAAEREGHHHHGEADGEAVIGIARRAFGGGDVQHDVSERESADEFGDERGNNFDFLRASPSGCP